MTKRKSTPPHSSPRVYSYIRFSTPEQALGDSERRQLELVRDLAKRTGLPFDESLRMTDRGMSGYHGTHRKKGALGAFLAHVKNGEVAPGSIFAVENTDRLSRECLFDVLQSIVFELIGKGITLQTLAPMRTFDRNSLEDGAIYELIGEIRRARSESQRKSDLAQANWKQKRRKAHESGTVLTCRCPAWLTVKGGKFEVIPEAAKTVVAIFEMYAGGIGLRTIVKKLNTEPYWTPRQSKRSNTTGWRHSYLRKIVAARAVLGEYQPHTMVEGKRKPEGEPIPNYFPAIVSSGLFHKAQKRITTNQGTGGKTGKAGNLFSGLVRCTYCGGPMHYVDKGPLPKGGQYLVCDQGRRGVKCHAYAIRYDEVETAILDNCKRLQPERVLPNPDEQTAKCAALRERLAAIDGQLSENDKRTANLLDQIERTDNAKARERYEARMTELDTQTAELTAERKRVAAELAAAETASTSFAKWKRGLAELRAALDAGNIEARLRMRAHLQELIDHVEVFAIGFRKGTDDLADYIDAAAESAGQKVPAKFLIWASEQATSKRGRFVRVHFKSGAVLDVVPKGSIASGQALVGGSWQFVRPDLGQLWAEFKAV